MPRWSYYFSRFYFGFALSLAMLCAWPAAAQMPTPIAIVPAGTRSFPDAALRGSLEVISTVEAKINGKPLRMAPGMRLFTPQNSLIMLHSVVGRSFKVNYVIEQSTGMLITAWILTDAEVAVKR